eukprot:2609914-Rhodomonas_salina.1
MASGFLCAGYHSTTPVTRYSATMASTNASLAGSKQVGMLGRSKGSSSKPTRGRHILLSKIVEVACPRYLPNRRFHAALHMMTRDAWKVGIGLSRRRPAPRGGEALRGTVNHGGA